ncbi:ribosomal protein S1, mitochondrial isoform X2 [Capsicum annuum]|uniref:ribosomal protein S1, mitochondrial isoform X2 n=2 Tax=Capsicum annuum TaxID=4072 RepID=UPI001FB05244|nr:ribosomal protein S1, mitochondrial isoform X2 [Capsicum annuum]
MAKNMASTYIRSLRNINIPKELIQMGGCRTFAVGSKGGAAANAPKASAISKYLFPRSNSSLFLCRGNALQSEVVRLREEMFLVDAGLGTPRICMQDELTGVPTDRATTRFENRVGLDLVASESPIKEQILERFFVDLVAGESVIKERAAARFNDLVGSTDVVAGEPLLLLPRKFRQNRALMELNKIWRMNKKVNGFILDKVRRSFINEKMTGGYAVAIAGYIAFLPIRSRVNRLQNGRFIIQSINPQKNNIVLF